MSVRKSAQGKKEIVLLGCLIAAVNLALGIQSYIFTESIAEPLEINRVKENSRLEKKARSLTVKISAGEFWGSGIIIARQDNLYRVLTNNHVLDKDRTTHQIHTADGEVYQGKAIATAGDFAGKDLAILEFKGRKNRYQVAKLGSVPSPGETVYAAGFPSNLAKPENLGWVLRSGVVWTLLQKPLQQGYQLGYTNEIEKGMSGGALFNKKGEVVAINGMHAYPLLGKPYLYADGTVPEENLVEQMVRHSFGIPITQIPDWVFKIKS